MRITFNGAAQTVTGSQYVLEVNGQRLMLECGMFQGKREAAFQRNRNIRVDAESIDAVILSHAHIDHSGNLPLLVKGGYRGKIYATPATDRMADLMLRDAAHIQESDTEYVNRKRERKGLPPVEPLYTVSDAAAVGDRLLPMKYGQEFEPVKGVTASLVEAGHILGSASIVLDVHEDGRKFRLWFSGDIGRYKLPLIKDPTLPEKADYLMMECTYGDKLHPDPDEAYREFRQTVQATIKRGGKVVIPAFAVGRTQELVYDLNRMMAAREIPAVPVYVDSPLAVGITNVFKQFPHYFDEETDSFVKCFKTVPLEFKSLHYVQSVDESKAINNKPGPMIIISASGMAETGRILHHLRNNIEDPKNTILIVSWQAPYTLGRQLAERARQIKIFGEPFERRAEVVTIGGLSAHADQAMLVKYARASQASLKQIFLVHGEPKGAFPLIEKIRDGQSTPIAYPDQYESVEI